MFDLKMKEAVCNWTVVLYCASYLCYFTGFPVVVSQCSYYLCSVFRYTFLALLDVSFLDTMKGLGDWSPDVA